MANQFSLLSKRRFMPMFCTQFLGAFNDNVFKQALILMLTFEGAQQLGMQLSLLNSLAALLFILPFFLFSATAGQLADKYEKSMLVRRVKLLELSIAVIASIGFIFKVYPLLFIALFLLGTQSTIFGPVKYAYLPQALKNDELVAGNGLFQTGTSLAILSAMIAAGFLVKMGDNYTIWLSIAVVLVALFGYISARAIPHTHASNKNLKLDFNIAKTSYNTIKYVKPYTALFYCLIGISWYWFYGATLITQIPEITKSYFQGDESVVIFVITIFSVGVVIGSLLCKTLTKGKISLALLPFGLAGISIFSCDLYLSLSSLSINQTSNFLSIPKVLRTEGTIKALIDFIFLGLFSGFYIVPLYAFMQAYAPSSHRARVIASNNILNALFMVVSAIFAIVVLTVLGMNIATLILIAAIMNIPIGWVIWQKMNKHKSELTLQITQN